MTDKKFLEQLKSGPITLLVNDDGMVIGNSHALAIEILELREQLRLIKLKLKKVVDEGIDTSTSGGMDFIKQLVADDEC